MLEEVQRLREQTLGEAMQDIAIALHMIFAEVFRHELRTSPELIAALVEELRQALQADATPTITLNRPDRMNAISMPIVSFSSLIVFSLTD